MEIILAKYCGFCYGVERAVNKAEESLSKSDKVSSLGHIIHNGPTVERLASNGLNTISSLDEVDDGVVVIRAHGVAPQIYEQAEKKGIKIVDTTCPFVKSAQNIAKKLVAEGYTLVIVGEKTHPEIIGIYEAVSKKAIIIKNVDEISEIDLSQIQRIGIVSQTTQHVETFQDVVDAFIQANINEVRVYNTICKDTINRQEEVRSMAASCDLIIVVGGKNSSNTKKLHLICQEAGVPAFHIETIDEIEDKWFSDAIKRVGVVSGASTPKYLIDQVIEYLNQVQVKK